MKYVLKKVFIINTLSNRMIRIFCYVLKTGLNDNIKDTKQFTDLNLTTTQGKWNESISCLIPCFISISDQTELDLSKKIVILMMTVALNMTFKQRKHSINLKCSICSKCSKGTIFIMSALILTLMTMVAVLVTKEWL